MISTLVGFELPLFGTHDNKSKTKEINFNLGWNHFDLKYILNYNIHVPCTFFFLYLFCIIMQENRKPMILNVSCDESRNSNWYKHLTLIYYKHFTTDEEKK